MGSLPIFLWQPEEMHDESWGDLQYGGHFSYRSPTKVSGVRCKYCGELTHEWETGSGGSDPDTIEHWQDCQFCGWASYHHWHDEECGESDYTGEYVLREFDANSNEVAIGELCSYIKRHEDSVLRLTPRRFEELACAAFRDSGYDVELTQYSRDGGYDLMLMGGPEGVALAEVKRWKDRVGVEVVRQLRGVQLREGAPRAVLVTSSGFTRGALAEADAYAPRAAGYAMDLVDAQQLLSMLNVFRTPTFTLAEVEGLRRHARDIQDAGAGPPGAS